MPAWHFVMSGLPSLLFAFITINTTPGAALEHLLSNPLKPAVGVVQQSVLYQRTLYGTINKAVLVVVACTASTRGSSLSSSKAWSTPTLVPVHWHRCVAAA